MRARWAAHRRAILLIAACLWTGAWVVMAETSRPRLPGQTRAERLRRVREALNWNGAESQRAAYTLVREFLLDYPDSAENDLRVQAAARMAALDPPDPGAAAEIEMAARWVLERMPPGKDPTRKNFEASGFMFGQSYGWPASFVAADFDGDGRKDVCFATPGGAHSFCFLFRHSASGWTAHLFSLGTNVMGLQAFDVTGHGPKAIVVTSLLTSEYEPVARTDVFAWRDGGLRCVLAGATRGGWQWDHVDLDGDGVQELRLYRSTEDRSSSNWQRTTAVDQTYRWNGKQYVLRGSGSPAYDVTPSGSLSPSEASKIGAEDLAAKLSDIERRLFAERNFDASLWELRQFEAAVRTDRVNAESKSRLLWDAAYHEALCQRKLGRTRAAEILLGDLWSGAPDTVWGNVAGWRMALSPE